MTDAAEALSPDASWSWPPIVLVALAGYLAIYGARWARVRARNGPRGASGWRLLAFLGGVLALFAALVSPIDILGEQMFFWHMVQHILLLDVAPLLLIGGLSKVLLRPVTAGVRRIEHAVGPLAHPATALALYVGTLWAWHVPAAYELALTEEPVHALQHMNLLAVGLLFWWHVLGPVRPRRRVRGMAVLAYVGGTKFLTGLLAIAITFSPLGRFFYDYYADKPRMWDFSVDDDQAAAGALMMTEELLVMTAAFAFMFVRMLGESEREEERVERYGAS